MIGIDFDDKSSRICYKFNFVTLAYGQLGEGHAANDENDLGWKTYFFFQNYISYFQVDKRFLPRIFGINAVSSAPKKTDSAPYKNNCCPSFCCDTCNCAVNTSFS